MSVHLSLAAPDVAHLSVAAGDFEIGAGRSVPTVAAVLGLISVVVSVLARARLSGRFGGGSGRAGAIAALVLGTISLIVGGLHTANSAGGFGTGNGLAGAIIAMVLGLVGMVLGGLPLARSRPSGHHPPAHGRGTAPNSVASSAAAGRSRPGSPCWPARSAERHGRSNSAAQAWTAWTGEQRGRLPAAHHGQRARRLPARQRSAHGVAQEVLDMQSAPPHP